ncbi:DUF2288 family protein [Haloferula helveola]|uniref:DUF2288 family protein n=1 Tax=Haloferula helveola TaxID=490095 RepID=UPI0030D4DD6A
MSEPDRMKYRILGEDQQSDEEKIAKYTGEVAWSYLKPHCERGVLIWVDPELDLKTVAKAFIDDQSEQVANWLGNGDLVKTGELHAAQWEGGDELFTAVVVTPFVLMQQLGG